MGLAFTFTPSLFDGTSSLQDETSIQATIDGQTETLDESGGASYSQVASDLYNLLIQNGLTGVSLENNEVIITNDFSGQPVASIQLDATDTSGNSMNWIDMGVDTIYSGTSTSTWVSSSTNPALPGQLVTFTATVEGSGATPTGTVTFEDGNTVLGTATLDANGNTTLTTSSLTAGSHNITAVYSGDDNNDGSSGSLTQVISQETSSSVSLSSSANPATLNQAVTFTATVSGNSGTPTGTVTFMDGDTMLGTGMLNASGVATLTTSTLTLGSHTITAVYGGDATYGSNAVVLTQTVNYAASSTSLSSSANPSQEGQTVTFMATVSGNNGTPTGSVTFLNGDTVLGTTPLDSNGNASLTTSALSPGSQIITVLYSGDGTYASSNTTLTQGVTRFRTDTSLTSSLSPSQAGQAVTFTANVSANRGTPTGSVTFLDGNTVLATAPLDDNGNATFTTSTLSAGSHVITAIYGGTAPFGASSNYVIQTVGQTSALDSSTSVEETLSDQAVTLTATVSGSSVTPTGSVTFYDGDTALGTSPLDGNGIATLTLSSLPPASKAITAIYSGDGTYVGSSGVAFASVVLPSLTLVSSSANPVALNQAVSFTATVSGSNGTPTGSVTFYDGTLVLGTVSLDANGIAILTTSALPLGSQTITAVYSGDDAYASSTASLTQQVVQAASGVSLSSSANPSPEGQAVTFTVTVAAVDPNAGTPTGTVDFYDGTTLLGTATLSVVNGQVQATFTTAAMGLGSHTILALYSGDSTFADSGASLEQTISS